MMKYQIYLNVLADNFSSHIQNASFYVAFTNSEFTRLKKKKWCIQQSVLPASINLIKDKWELYIILHICRDENY